ncbi:D-glycero-beta-D-manno-heptose 1-phosphate adenylyltransferase [Streptomyces sp. NPDC007088]|uniref:D-glycero-beta-D-manno-heptose 1-phosphate adenylyltransferase n=1 Tax=Streptomyces sp. NPDC007088 TaxID=3364773 RepID=UPI0036CF54A6
MSGPAPLLVVGDALLDEDLDGHVGRLAPDAPVPVLDRAVSHKRPGGAALAALLAAREGREVTFVTALGEDPASTELRRLLDGEVRLIALPLSGPLARKTRVRGDGHCLLRLDEGDGRARESTGEARAALERAATVLVSDYGRGTAHVLREALTAAAARGTVVWDPHPRGARPVRGARLVTPSAAEAAHWAARAERDGPGAGSATNPRGAAPDALDAAVGAGRVLVQSWETASVCVTLGRRGAVLTHGDDAPLYVPAPWEADGDPCGAGDRFASAAAGLLADGALTEEAVVGAVTAAARYVAEGGAAAVRPGPSGAPSGDGRRAAKDAYEVAARTRAAGGRVVATGGCFDLLHAGHVALLQAARKAGDCLVVCVNSDASVRRGKGPGRPLVAESDRVRVLRALGCVDAVLVFDEDTPARVLRSLRPDVWAKGGDYVRAELPEADLVESWGGQVLLVPYLDGRSTTALARRAAAPHDPPASVRGGGR